MFWTIFFKNGLNLVKIGFVYIVETCSVDLFFTKQSTENKKAMNSGFANESIDISTKPFHVLQSKLFSHPKYIVLIHTALKHLYYE